MFTLFGVVFGELVFLSCGCSGVLTCLGVLLDSVRNLIIEANKHESLKEIWDQLHSVLYIIIITICS